MYYELSIWNTEVEEVRDAVLVTDGDSEIGQVCIGLFWTQLLFVNIWVVNLFVDK